MYCISCGVKLADTEQKCPLCGVEVFHPMLQRQPADSPYPANQYPAQEVSPWGLRLIIAVVFFLPLLTVLLCDLPLNGQITWSGYVIGALILLYVSVVLPFWFRKPNPVIFVPISFAAAGLYLLYINYATAGNWFLSLAFPVTGFCGIVLTTIVTLNRYVRRGRLYVYGGSVTAIGLFFPVLELLLHITFDGIYFIGWSFYPMAALVLFGCLLIFLGICRPARELMERKFFL